MSDDVPAEPADWSETHVYEKELSEEHIKHLRKHGALVIQWEGVGDPPSGLDEYGVEVRLTVPDGATDSDHRVDEVLE